MDNYDDMITWILSHYFKQSKVSQQLFLSIRQRARGMHFSREHMGQLLAKEAKLWDEVSVESSTSAALSLNEAVKTGDNTTPNEQKTSAKAVTPKLPSQGKEKESGSTLVGSQMNPPTQSLKDAGTHRLAWSCDGDRSPSPSDT